MFVNPNLWGRGPFAGTLVTDGSDLAWSSPNSTILSVSNLATTLTNPYLVLKSGCLVEGSTYVFRVAASNGRKGQVRELRDRSNDEPVAASGRRIKSLVTTVVPGGSSRECWADWWYLGGYITDRHRTCDPFYNQVGDTPSVGYDMGLHAHISDLHPTD